MTGAPDRDCPPGMPFDLLGAGSVQLDTLVAMRTVSRLSTRPTLRSPGRRIRSGETHWGGSGVTWRAHRSPFPARPSSNTSCPRMREPTPTRPIPVPEAAARWVAATGAAMTWVVWSAVVALRSWSACTKRLDHSPNPKCRPGPRAGIHMTGAPDRDCPPGMPFDLLGAGSGPARHNGGDGGVAWRAHRSLFSARPSSNTSFPRRRERTATRPIPVPEGSGWRVPTCAGLTWMDGERGAEAVHVEPAAARS